MRAQTAALGLAALGSLVAAVQPAVHSGFNVIWSDTFPGQAGDPPNDKLWNIAQDVHTNNEVQEYTNASHNLQITGGQTLQIIPRKSASGAWTSGRIETQAAFAPAANTTTLVEASIRFGGHAAAAKQGLWPAFWLLGDSMRHGTAWPACGELDVLEMINGRPTGYGTAHCAACGGPAFAQGSVAVPDNDWHAWSLVVDRSRYGAAGWTAETITWWRDGALFHELAGGDVDEATWATLAHSPLYIILNVAVGGDWPGNPDEATLDGYGAMMEVEYVAVYEAA